MSLVTAAMSSSPRRRLQSCSMSAVLPEPTGPPTPTRRGCLVIGDPFASLASPHPAREHAERLGTPLIGTYSPDASLSQRHPAMPQRCLDAAEPRVNLARFREGR